MRGAPNARGTVNMLAPYFVAVEGEGFAVLQAANKADALQMFLRAIHWPHGRAIPRHVATRCA